MSPVLQVLLMVIISCDDFISHYGEDTLGMMDSAHLRYSYHDSDIEIFESTPGASLPLFYNNSSQLYSDSSTDISHLGSLYTNPEGGNPSDFTPLGLPPIHTYIMDLGPWWGCFRVNRGPMVQMSHSKIIWLCLTKRPKLATKYVDYNDQANQKVGGQVAESYLHARVQPAGYHFD